MDVISQFEVGQKYSNDEIMFSLSVGNLGGVRPSVDSTGQLRHITLMTSSSDNAQSNYVRNPYHDRIEGNILIYTGAGRKGDQALSGANKRILDQRMTSSPIYGFVNIGRQSYEFLGLLELLRHYQEQQLDQELQLRTVWLFEFRIHRIPKIVPIDSAREIMRELTSESQKTIVEAEREVIIPSSPESSPTELVGAEDVRSQLLDINPFKFEHVIKAVIEKRGSQMWGLQRGLGTEGSI